MALNRGIAVCVCLLVLLNIAFAGASELRGSGWTDVARSRRSFVYPRSSGDCAGLLTVRLVIKAMEFAVRCRGLTQMTNLARGFPVVSLSVA